jgi:hypothetical protein
MDPFTHMNRPTLVLSQIEHLSVRVMSDPTNEMV